VAKTGGRGNGRLDKAETLKTETLTGKNAPLNAEIGRDREISRRFSFAASEALRTALPISFVADLFRQMTSFPAPDLSLVAA
jgi:hypothetical protein